MEVSKGMNRNGWFVWCGVEKHEEVRNLTKAEALQIAGLMAEKWPRVLIGHRSSKYPRGAYLGGICYGRRSGVAEIREI